MLISELDFSTSYRFITIYVHILAVRPNVDRLMELIVTDYTRNDKLREQSTNYENKLNQEKDQQLVLQIKADLFEKLAVEFKKKTSRALFEDSNVDILQSRWIDISASFCFSKLDVRVRKAIGGFVNNGSIISCPSEQFSLFWVRFSATLEEQIYNDPKTLLSLIEGCLDKSIVEKFMTQGSEAISNTPESETWPAVKEEVDEANHCNLRHHNSLFQMSLEPLNLPQGNIRVPESHTRIDPNRYEELNFTNIGNSEEFLTQIGTNPKLPRSEIKPNGAVGNTFLTDLSQSNPEDLSFNIPSKFSSIRDLNSLNSVIDGKIYLTKARIVGFLPQILTHICTKLFIVKDSEPTIDGLQYRSLQLMISDSTPGILTPLNFLRAIIPKRSILKFFSCKHTEQLYILLLEKEKLLKQVIESSKWLEFSLVYERGTDSWELEDLALENLA